MIRTLLWSTERAEYGSYNWLRREVAIKLGYAADHRLLGRSDRAYVDSIIESGVMLFAQASSPATPDPVPDGEGRTKDSFHVEEEQKDATRRAPHRWSFLNKVETLTLKSGKYQYELPVDFGHAICEPTTTVKGGRIAIVTDQQLRQVHASNPQSGTPQYCSTRLRTLGGSNKKTVDILFYPTPDADDDGNEIMFEYSLVPGVLTDSEPYPPGGIEHAETLLAYCYYYLAMRTGEGMDVASAHLQHRLTASIVMDRRSSKATADGIWEDDTGIFNHAYVSRLVGRHIGAGPNPNAWSHQQSQLIAEVLRRMRRRVYNPPVMPGEKYPHDWTFLRPAAEISLSAGEHLYDLPEDFAQLFGPMTHATTGSTLYPPIRFVSEVMIRQLLQRQSASARPDRAAIRPKSHDSTTGTRYEILFWPVPDGDYDIHYRYRINPQFEPSIPADPTVYDIHGGNRYSEMFLEAALLAADELMGVKNSAHYDRWMRACFSSIGDDRKEHQPDTLGYNNDWEGNRQFKGDWHDYDENVVTYNGIAY